MRRCCLMLPRCLGDPAGRGQPPYYVAVEYVSCILPFLRMCCVLRALRGRLATSLFSPTTCVAGLACHWCAFLHEIYTEWRRRQHLREHTTYCTYYLTAFAHILSILSGGFPPRLLIDLLRCTGTSN